MYQQTPKSTAERVAEIRKRSQDTVRPYREAKVLVSSEHDSKTTETLEQTFRQRFADEAKSNAPLSIFSDKLFFYLGVGPQQNGLNRRDWPYKPSVIPPNRALDFFTTEDFLQNIRAHGLTDIFAFGVGNSHFMPYFAEGEKRYGAITRNSTKISTTGHIDCYQMTLSKPGRSTTTTTIHNIKIATPNSLGLDEKTITGIFEPLARFVCESPKTRILVHGGGSLDPTGNLAEAFAEWLNICMPAAARTVFPGRWLGSDDLATLEWSRKQCEGIVPNFKQFVDSRIHASLLANEYARRLENGDKIVLKLEAREIEARQKRAHYVEEIKENAQSLITHIRTIVAPKLKEDGFCWTKADRIAKAKDIITALDAINEEILDDFCQRFYDGNYDAIEKITRRNIAECLLASRWKTNGNKSLEEVLLTRRANKSNAKDIDVNGKSRDKQEKRVRTYNWTMDFFDLPNQASLLPRPQYQPPEVKSDPSIAATR